MLWMSNLLLVSHQQMDIEAISFATNDSLLELGIKAKGDVFALKAFCQRHLSTSKLTTDNDYTERKRKLVEERSTQI